MNRHIWIEAVSPSVDGGLYPVKRIVGDVLTVRADIFRDGHESIAAQVRYCERDRLPRGSEEPWASTLMEPLGNDRWEAPIGLRRNTEMVFCVDAWTDIFATWLIELGKKVEANQQVPSEVQEGQAHLQRAANNALAADKVLLESALGALRASQHDPRAALAAVDRQDVRQAARRSMPRPDLLTTQEYRVTVDRPRALYSTWYELFPRSQGSHMGRGASLREAAARLPEIAAMGFDVVYLPPIHPIGTSHRKGPNNALTAAPGDPGCPWAIGNQDGGHTAVAPELGTLADFDFFVAEAKRLDMEIALDYAIQCSPDHPWVKEHPAWFSHRPDGSIKYAENPPKKYQDVYPVNFDTEDRQGLWHALHDVLIFWIKRGVRIFRVDNPHTKPLDFWEWAIAAVQKDYPDVLFLAEAFTRPKVMKALAKLGFTQSYTYFTWRNDAPELTEYLQELCYTSMREYFRPNFFANTPDILPEILQTGGPAAFKMRLILAATLSPTYGIYSGFELCEGVPLVPGKEEYMNSEKYEVRVRDWNAPGNIKDLVRQVNAIRATSPALQRLDSLQFLGCDNPSILFYGKRLGDDILLIAVNLDPHNPHHGTAFVPADFVRVQPGETYDVVDLLSGAVYTWGDRNYVRLLPDTQPAHILRVKWRRT